MMKYLMLTAVGLALNPVFPRPIAAQPTSAVSAQNLSGKITLKTEKSAFMAAEPLRLEIELENTGKVNLVSLAQNVERYYSFELKGPDGKIIPLKAIPTVRGGELSAVAPLKKMTGYIYLDRAFDILNAGKYSLRVFKSFEPNGDPSPFGPSADAIPIYSEPLEFQISSYPVISGWIK